MSNESVCSTPTDYSLEPAFIKSIAFTVILATIDFGLRLPAIAWSESDWRAWILDLKDKQK